jgi:hypothetical protein
MRFGFASGSGVLLLCLNACVAVDHKKQLVEDGSETGGATGAGGSSAGGSKGAGGAHSSGGKGNAGGSGAGGVGGAGDDGGVPTSTVPVLKSLTAHVTGRAGEGVTVSVEGEDGDKDVIFLGAQWQDADGNPVVAFDSNWDGIPDTDKARVFFDKSVSGQATFDATITAPAFMVDHPRATTLVAHLEDAAGQQSDDLTAEIAPQGTKRSKEACDPAIVDDRCDVGLACIGDDPVCKAADPPTIEELAYVRGADGPHLLVSGTDAADDITTLKLEFLSKTNTPISVDLNGDQVPDSATFDLGVVNTSKDGVYFVNNLFGLGFDKTVPRVAVTPVDGQANKGTRKLVDVADPPSRAVGQSCDPRGFNVCSATGGCAESTTSDASACVTATSLRTDACTSGAELNPDKGALSAFGRADGPSLWDPPPGCAPVLAANRPEGVVRLHLENDVTQLTVSSALAETAFNTVLYVLPACEAKGTAALGCNDDTDGISSTVVLTNVSAGDYIVVIDSDRAVGGGFGVSITVE